MLTTSDPIFYSNCKYIFLMKYQKSVKFKFKKKKKKKKSPCSISIFPLRMNDLRLELLTLKPKPSNFCYLFSGKQKKIFKTKRLMLAIKNKKLTRYHWCWKRGSVGSDCGGKSTKFSTFKELYPRFSSLQY